MCRVQFADGVGQISRDLLQYALARAPHAPKSRNCCGFQFRLGGIKGTVFLNPELEGRQLLFRNSMKKFDSQHLALEVCSFALPGAGFINHYVIMLLAYRCGYP